MNQSAERLLGVSARHILEQNFFELIRFEFDYSSLSQLVDQNQSCFIEDTPLRTATGITRVNMMASGREVDRESFLLLEIQSSEHHSHIRKDMELQHQSEVSNHLIRNLAHEIKNPLGGIKGAAQLLERKLPDEVSRRYTQIIIQESDRLGSLVDKLLLPAAPEPPQLINIHRITEQVVDIITLQSEEQSTFVRDYDPSLPEIRVSPGQIQQALLNLVKNAVEAVSHNGKITLRTRILMQHTIGKTQYKQVIRIDVLDNGPGIAPEITRDIFFPTISGKNSSGLGLSIAQSLVQRHAGIIEVTSEPGNTCFSIFLPLEHNHE